MVVDLDHQVRSFPQRSGITWSWFNGNSPRGPATHEPSGKTGSAEAVIASIRGISGELPRLSRIVCKHQRMVDRPAVVRAKFRSAHIYVVVQVHGNDETTELVRPLRGHIELCRRGQDLVRLAQLPSFRKLRQGRLVGSIAFRRSVTGPLRNQGNLLVGKATRIFEVAISRLSFPRRHHPRPG